MAPTRRSASATGSGGSSRHVTFENEQGNAVATTAAQKKETEKARKAEERAQLKAQRDAQKEEQAAAKRAEKEEAHRRKTEQKRVAEMEAELAKLRRERDL